MVGRVLEEPLTGLPNDKSAQSVTSAVWISDGRISRKLSGTLDDTRWVYL